MYTWGKTGRTNNNLVILVSPFSSREEERDGKVKRRQVLWGILYFMHFWI